MPAKNYALIDSGEGRKLEQFGPYLLDRPSAQSVWLQQMPKSEWQKADLFFTREGEGGWKNRQGLPEEWKVEVASILFKISTTDFGHIGIFPEQKPFWDWIQKVISEAQLKRSEPIKVLNLFAYSGGATLAAAKAGAHVCHLDASKVMVSWARENAAINHLKEHPIRWIVDDVGKFLKRELRRGSRYDAIILDPPSFGRGASGELFKIEDDLIPILHNCRELLSVNPLFLLLSCHTPGYTPIVMHTLLKQLMQQKGGEVDSGEMCLSGKPEVFPLPSGTYARWVSR